MASYARAIAPRASILAPLALLAALCACTLGPTYRPPEVLPGAEAALVSLDPHAESALAPPDAWWKLYNDPRLDALLESAFAANADLAAAQANLIAAGALFSAARGARYPGATLDAGAIRGRDAGTDEILELGGHPPQDVWIYESVAQASYEIDLFGRVRRSIEAAHANAAAVAATRDAVKVTVAAETTRAYALICSLGEELAVAHHSIDVLERELGITTQRHAAGAGSDFDVVRAQGLAAQTRAAIPTLEGQRRAALFQLAALVGRAPSKAPLQALDCVAPPQLSSLLPVGDGAMLLKRRPDVRQAERVLAAATARIGVATADLYPRVRLVGLYGGIATNFKDLTSEPGLTWGIGPSVSWNFPNQIAARALVAQAEANAAAALASFDSVVLNALKETEQALAGYGAEIAHRQALAEVQAKAHAAFDLTHDRLLAGSISELDLLTAEQTMVAADAAVAASDAALVQDQIAVFKALGGGWQWATPEPALISDRDAR